MKNTFNNVALIFNINKHLCILSSLRNAEAHAK